MTASKSEMDDAGAQPLAGRLPRASKVGRVAVGLAFVLTVSWLSFVLWSTPSFQDCLDEQIHVDRSLTEEHVRRIALARLDTVCAVRSLEETGEAITAIGTVLIALFTLTLWLSTKRLWQEAMSASRI